MSQSILAVLVLTQQVVLYPFNGNVFNTSLHVEGVDYIPGPYFATIPAGMINVSFSISIDPDSILEGDEVFLLTIEQISIPTVNLSDDSALVVIIDDDSKFFRLLDKVTQLHDII